MTLPSAAVIGEEPTPALANEVAEECERRLAVLDEELRNVALWRLEGYTNQEIADHLGISTSAVEARLHRARQRMRDELAAMELTGTHV